jgi:diguanylate cyclase (GGDEF)-like protein
MPGRHEHASLRRGGADRTGLALAIYHASRDVDAHVALLRRSAGFRVTCVPQRSARRPPARRVDVVLWELEPGRPPDLRRLSALAGQSPVVSYSARGGRAVADLSRAVGFLSHLSAPLRPSAVARVAGRLVRPDAAERLRAGERRLRAVFARAGTLAELIRATNASLDPVKVADALAARAATWFALPAWAVVAADPQTGVQTLLAQRMLGTELESAALAIGGWILAHERMFASANLATDRRVGGAAGAVLAWPLLARGRVVASLVGLDRTPAAREPHLAPSTLAALQPLLEAGGLALDNALRVQRAEALSVTDDLTQLYNARYLAQALRRETKRASRSGRPLSLLFIDLDGFKAVNDAHGHLCGSRALVEVAAVIRSTARETDVVARFGGDEFAVVLPDTGSEGAVSVGARIRDRIGERTFLTGEGLAVRLTASVGVATLPDVAASADALIRAADQAMYWVKAHGKDGICVAQRSG